MLWEDVTVNEFIDWLNTSFQTFDPLWRNLIAGFAIMLETSILVGLIIPGDTVVLTAGTLVQNWFDFGLLWVSVMAGSFVGESLGFYIGRLSGPRIRSSKAGRRIPEHIWHRADTFVESRGGIAIAISRFLPVLHSVVPLTAGMTRMTYKTFISWTVAACALWTSLYLGVGWFARNATQAMNDFKLGAAVFVSIIAVFLIVITLVKKRLDKATQNMIHDSEKAKTRAKKLRDAEMKRPNL
ncbi:MAG: DedA family protein [Micrococcales bacterium]|nr:DedA family protein [Micrococcales bacterium]